jgi:hypothetical protein
MVTWFSSWKEAGSNTHTHKAWWSYVRFFFKKARWTKNGSCIPVRENCGSFHYVVSLNLKAITGSKRNLENTAGVEACRNCVNPFLKWARETEILCKPCISCRILNCTYQQHTTLKLCMVMGLPNIRKVCYITKTWQPYEIIIMSF